MINEGWQYSVHYPTLANFIEKKNVNSIPILSYFLAIHLFLK
jgi:hypothetical protein